MRLTNAAKTTEIDITIIEGTTDDGVRQGEISNGYNLARAFEHMRLWRRIVDESISSALIMSSDTVWDAQIRSRLSSLRDAAQDLTNSSPDDPSLQNKPIFHPVLGPYGNDWDMLWLGHCGEFSEDLNSSTNDATKVPHATKIWTGQDGRPLEGPHPDTSIRLTSNEPVGELYLSSYAVSYRGAMRLLSLAEDMRGLLDRYVEERCQDGDLKCVIEWPQIMSQRVRPSR